MTGKIPPKPISQITVGQYKWKVNVVVLDKTDARTNSKGRRTQKVLLQDKQGTVIEMILWNQQIDVLQNMLIPTRTYEVAGAKVQEINPDYLHMSPGQPLEWIMIQSTSVEPVTNAAEVIPFPPMQTTPLSIISGIVGTKTPVDVIAIILSMNGPKEAHTETKTTTLQEIVVIDKTFTRKTLTMWGHFLTHQALDIADCLHTYPVLVCRRLLVNDYADGSLTTTPFCYMTINPDIPEATDMRTWFDDNKEIIMQSANPVQSLQMETGHQQLEEGASQALTFTPDNANSLRLQGKLSIVDLQQDINFCECETCFKAIMKEAKQEFYCRTCNTNKQAVAKCKVHVKIDGDTGNIFATMYDENAEELLGMNAEQTHAMQQQDISNMLVEINQKLQSKVVTAIVKAASKVYAGQKPKYTIQQWAYCDIEKEKSGPEKRTSKELTDTPEKTETKKRRQKNNAMPAKPVIQPTESGTSSVNPEMLQKLK